ncbi:MAG: M15 family metallopeptidase [Legionella sp.]|nr:M15 family metallopeptidase [Legionella sp.]
MIATEFDQKYNDSVEFNNETHERIQVYPIYFKLGFGAVPTIFGRYLVLERLIKALDLLPPEYGLLIWDIYRPRSVQAKIFNWMREEIRKKFPQLTEQENFDKTKKYASLPSVIGDDYCPPHLSGGAIDLTLYETASGNELEMGTPFDDCTERAHRDFFNIKGTLSIEEEKIQYRRNLLCSTMEQVGFTSYQYEWWHFDIGNILWSKAVQQPAFFTPLFGDKEWPDM